MTPKCFCCDPNCPVGHKGQSCDRPAETMLRRVDMADAGEPYCEPCACDALDYGVFAEVTG